MPTSEKENVGIRHQKVERNFSSEKKSLKMKSITKNVKMNCTVVKTSKRRKNNFKTWLGNQTF